MSGNRGEMPPLPSGAAIVAPESEQESAESLLAPLAPPVVPPVPLPPEVPKRNKPLEVFAIREGFYNGERRSPKQTNKDGSPKVFTIANLSQLGSWMKLVDPVLERERQANKNGKKAGKFTR